MIVFGHDLQWSGIVFAITSVFVACTVAGEVGSKLSDPSDSGTSTGLEDSGVGGNGPEVGENLGNAIGRYVYSIRGAEFSCVYSWEIDAGYEGNGEDYVWSIDLLEPGVAGSPSVTQCGEYNNIATTSTLYTANGSVYIGNNYNGTATYSNYYLWWSTQEYIEGGPYEPQYYAGCLRWGEFAYLGC